jgi:DNA-directed RNA polymerase subunit N (RpoN/RPB10)
MPVKTIAAFSVAEQACPDTLLGANGDYVRFELPPFQRGLRWKKDKRLKFLESLLAGWPTGAIVLTKVKTTSHASGNGRIFTWSVIDGQQRLATFSILRNDFWTEPWYIFTDEVDRAIEELLTVTTIDTDLKVKEAIKSLTKGSVGNRFNEDILEDSDTFLSELCRELGIVYPVDHDNLTVAKDCCKRIRISLRDQKKALDETLVGVITIEPSQGSTPNEIRYTTSSIFSALNSGVPLKKYELLAALWATLQVKWADYLATNSNFSSDASLVVKSHQKAYMGFLMRDRILDSYRNSEDELELDPEIEEFTDDDVSLFDYLYALSAISKSYPTHNMRNNSWPLAVRSSMPDGKSLSEIAFDVAALLFSGSLGSKAIDNLRVLFPLKGIEYDIGLFAEHFLGAVEVLEDSLSPFTKHATRNKGAAGVGRTLATSYLASITNTIYDVKLGTDDRLTIGRRSGQRERTVDNLHALSQARRISSIKSNLPAWWLFDTLSEEFQGSNAYINASERAWKVFDFQSNSTVLKIGSVSENDYLLQPPTLSMFLDVFRNIFTREFRVNAAPINRIPSQSALTLFHVLFSGKSTNMKNYHMDHVVPYRAGKNSGVPKLTIPIPLNHVANWFPLDAGLNTSRLNTPWNVYITRVTDAAQVSEVLEDILIDPDLLTSAAYSSTDNFGKIMLVRFVGMIDRALLKVALSEYISLSHDEKLALLEEQIVKLLITTLGFQFDSHEVMNSVLVS